jgi:MFS family permease
MSAVSIVTGRAVPGFLREMFSSGNRFITLIAVLAALGGFLFGYDTGVVGGAAPYIKKSLGIGSFGESWVVGSLLLGAIAGALLAGKLADLLSRKWTKFIGGAIYATAALGSAFGLYAGFGVAAVAFFFWKLPETKDRSLEDIERQVGE